MSGKNRYKSAIFKQKRMAGARALWKATGAFDVNKPLIAVVNSFSQFVPGHVHLQNVGQFIAREIEKSGGIAKEFNTIAIDDGIAMGHDGMLYSLPSRDVIADSVEYVVNAHKVDAMICISNCDKITPGMMMAMMRLNIPTVMVSGGPMEAGVMVDKESNVKKFIDLVDAIVVSADDKSSDEKVAQYEESACPTCGSCSGMFTANSMNCLAEALGVAMVGNGSVLATHKFREQLFTDAAKKIVEISRKHYEEDDDSVLPRNIASKQAFENAMSLDIAMGGSTNTILHILAIAAEGKIDFKLDDIAALSLKTPTLCKVAPSSSYHMQDVHRAGGVFGILGELNRAGLIHGNQPTVNGKMSDVIASNDVAGDAVDASAINMYKAAPCGLRNPQPFSSSEMYTELDIDRVGGCIRSAENAYFKTGGLAVLYGNIAKEGCVVKVAGVSDDMLYFEGVANVCDSQDEAVEKILSGEVKKGDAIIIRFEGPKGGPGMQEMLYPTSYLKSMDLDKHCALITDGRFSGGTAGLSVGHVSPESAEGGFISVIQNGDKIVIDIKNRTIMADVSDEEFAKRLATAAADAVKPKRVRNVSQALKMYAHFVGNASSGAIRKIDDK